MEKEWWRKSVVYQVYPQSFQDSNGDGIGDLNGLRTRLPYLANLGIDLIWICPIFKSPMVDNGYDVADYYQVDPRYGTNEDLVALIKEAASYGIRLLLDLVINHCSDQHPWFQKALIDPESEEAKYFYFKQTDDGSVPSNWRSNFGGSTWTQLPDGRWYYHTFAPQQPDLNWENPKLRKELFKMVNWWLEQGIAGFRIDAITFIKKDLSFASRPTADNTLYPVENFENYPGIDVFLNELKAECFDKYNCMTVGEAPGVGLEHIGEYSGKDGFFSMIFDFEWINMMGETDKSSTEAVDRWKEKIFASQLATVESGWSGLCLENHDQPRCANKFLEAADININSLSALGVLYMFMYGTPFIYQGQEIGMTNDVRTSIDQFLDVSAHTLWRESLENGIPEEKTLQYLNDYGRDNSRSPFHWDASTNAGFTTGEPWIAVNSNYTAINAAQQLEDSHSLFACYKQLIRIRKDPAYADIFASGSFEPVFKNEKGIIAYKRVLNHAAVTVIINFTNQETQVTHQLHKVLYNNHANVRCNESKLTLAPYQAIVEYVEG